MNYFLYASMGFLVMCFVWVVVKMIGIQMETIISKYTDHIIEAIQESKDK